MSELGDIMRQQITRGVEKVFRVQAGIAQGKPLRRTGRLIGALTAPDFTVNVEGQGVVTTAEIPLYIRFLDMKSKGNNKIYNRVVFGVMGEARRRIEYGYTDEIAQQVREQLVQAGATLK